MAMMVIDESAESTTFYNPRVASQAQNHKIKCIVAVVVYSIVAGREATVVRSHEPPLPSSWTDVVVK